MTWRRWKSSDVKLVQYLTQEETINLDLHPCGSCGNRWGRSGISWATNIANGDARIRLSYSKIFHYVAKVVMLRPLEVEKQTRCGRYFYVGLSD